MLLCAGPEEIEDSFGTDTKIYPLKMAKILKSISKRYLVTWPH